MVPDAAFRRELEEAGVEERGQGQENRAKRWNQNGGMRGQKNYIQLAEKNEKHCSNCLHNTALLPGSLMRDHGKNPSYSDHVLIFRTPPSGPLPQGPCSPLWFPHSNWSHS